MLLLYPLLFSLLLYRHYSWRHITPLTYFIIILYLGSTITANYLYYSGYSNYKEIKISFHSVAYLFICLSILISGISKIEKRISMNIEIIQYSKIKHLLWIVIILSFISIYHSFSLISQISNLDIAEIRFGYNQRNLFDYGGGRLIDYLVSFGTIFYAISLFLFYYIFSYYPKKKLIIILLLVSSTSIVFSNLAIAGRDGIIKWILLLVGNYLIFSSLITNKEKKQLLCIIILVILVALYLFVIVTIGRFGSNPNQIINNVLDYYGQGFINFSKIFELFPNGNFSGRMTFPVFFPNSEVVSMANLNSTITNVSFQLNVFTTIIGSLFLDLGYSLTLVIVFAFYFLINFVRKIYVNSLAYWFFFIYLFEVIVSGIFYFMNYSPAFQKLIVLFICYIIILKTVSKPNILIFSNDI